MDGYENLQRVEEAIIYHIRASTQPHSSTSFQTALRYCERTLSRIRYRPSKLWRPEVSLAWNIVFQRGTEIWPSERQHINLFSAKERWYHKAEVVPDTGKRSRTNFRKDSQILCEQSFLFSQSKLWKESKFISRDCVTWILDSNLVPVCRQECHFLSVATTKKEIYVVKP